MITDPREICRCYYRLLKSGSTYIGTLMFGFFYQSDPTKTTLKDFNIDGLTGIMQMALYPDMSVRVTLEYLKVWSAMLNKLIYELSMLTGFTFYAGLGVANANFSQYVTYPYGLDYITACLSGDVGDSSPFISFDLSKTDPSTYKSQLGSAIYPLYLPQMIQSNVSLGTFIPGGVV